jgi:hypothetical protein
VGLFEKTNTSSGSTGKVSSLIKENFPNLEFAELKPGFFGTRIGSTALTIFINDQFGDANNPVLTVMGSVIFNARDDDKLYRFLAADCITSIFGSWGFENGDKKGTVNVYYKQHFILNDIDSTEFVEGVAGVAETSDNNDELIKEKFGGNRCVEQFGWEE